MKRRLLLFLISVFFTFNSYAQSSKSILLKSGTRLSQNDFNERINESVPASDIFQGYYYCLIQFNVMPGKEQQNFIESTGIKLVGYIPYNSFYAAIPVGYNLSQLSTFNPRTIVRLQASDKINNQLRFGDYEYARKKAGALDLVFQYYKNIPADVIQQELVAKGCSVLERTDA